MNPSFLALMILVSGWSFSGIAHAQIGPEAANLPNMVTWTTTVTNLRGQNGQPFAFLCPPNGAAIASVWGTDIYTDDSSVCIAAVHAGVIMFSSGGPVIIEIRPGQSSYTGTTRNGVVSSSYGGWSGSFAFVKATDRPRGPGDQVLVVAYGKDETDGSDVGWNELYPNPSFDDDPGRRGLPNARWQGSHSWDGSRLCLSIKNLEAPHPPAHTLAIGYTVTLTSGTFEDGTTTKTFVLYRYSGVPAQKEVTQCFATRTVETGVPTGRSFTAQPRVPEAAASPPAGWETTASAHRGKNGQRFTYVCPAGGTPTRVWGTDVYTDDSSVCTAAVHTGRIVPSTGGSVTIEIKPGQNSYMGTGRNDILSESYGPWTGSFIFVGAGQPQGRSYTAQPRQAESSDPLKKEFGESLKKMFKP
jgi:hypothetical protein